MFTSQISHMFFPAYVTKCGHQHKLGTMEGDNLGSYKNWRLSALDGMHSVWVYIRIRSPYSILEIYNFISIPILTYI